ncbi:hypothetical protein ACLB2K_062768 [Fragaria x ananassa]
MPKLEFFTSVGIRGTALAHIISGNPKFLTFGLEENLRPCYGIIRSLPIPDKMVGLVLSKLYQGFTVTAPLLSNIAPNTAFLKAVQVPESAVNLYLSITLFALSRETHKFKENVERVISMGISPSSSSFMKALYVISAVDELNGYKGWKYTRPLSETDEVSDETTVVISAPSAPSVTDEDSD